MVISQTRSCWKEEAGRAAQFLRFYLQYIEPLGQLLRQSTQFKGITVAGIEHKVAMFADGVLVYLEEPEKSFKV